MVAARPVSQQIAPHSKRMKQPPMSSPLISPMSSNGLGFVALGMNSFAILLNSLKMAVIISSELMMSQWKRTYVTARNTMSFTAGNVLVASMRWLTLTS